MKVGFNTLNRGLSPQPIANSVALSSASKVVVPTALAVTDRATTQAGEPRVKGTPTPTPTLPHAKIGQSPALRLPETSEPVTSRVQSTAAGSAGARVLSGTLVRALLHAGSGTGNPTAVNTDSSSGLGFRQVVPATVSERLVNPSTLGRRSSDARNLVQALIETKGQLNLLQGQNGRSPTERLLPQAAMVSVALGSKTLPNFQAASIPGSPPSVASELVTSVGHGVSPRQAAMAQRLGLARLTIQPSQQRPNEQAQNKATDQSTRTAWQLNIQNSDSGLASLRAGKQGGSMLSPEGVNMMPRPNTVYVEGAAAGVRVEPEQARILGLRAGETINAVVAQRQDGNVLLIGKQQLPLPDRMNLPAGQVALLVRVVAGQTVLALTDPTLAAQVAAGAKRTDADARFTRLLNHVGSFHLARTLSPGILTGLTEQSGAPQMQRSLAALLLDSRQLSGGRIRSAVEAAGLFAEHQASLNPQQGAPGLKSLLIGLRALMQSRQMETTSISGAIDEIEARQLDSLAQQTSGRTHYSWVLPFADQYPVYIELEHQQMAENEDGMAQSVWNVDLEIGLSPSVAMTANVRVDQDGGLGLRLWLPDPSFYSMAEAGRGQLEDMIASQGLSLTGLTVYPVARDAGTVDDSRPRMGVSIDA